MCIFKVLILGDTKRKALEYFLGLQTNYLKEKAQMFAREDN